MNTWNNGVTSAIGDWVVHRAVILLLVLATGGAAASTIGKVTDDANAQAVSGVKVSIPGQTRCRAGLYRQLWFVRD